MATDGVFADGDWVESKDQDPEGEVRLTQLADVGEGVFRDRSNRFLNAATADRLRCTYLEPGDVLIARMPEPLGRACLFPGSDRPAVTVVDVRILRPGKSGVFNRWLMWAINSPQVRQQIREYQTGTTRKRISGNNLAKVKIAVPPLAEQHRIVEALEEQLSRLDAGASTLTLARKRLDGLRKRILVSSVPDELPRSWEMSTVEQVGTLELGRARNPDWHHGPEMRPYLRVANVFEDRIDTTDVMEMDFSGVWEKYRLYPGDVLLNEGQSPHLVGRPALYRGFPENVAFTNSLIRFKAGKGVIPEWALLVFRSHLHSKRFMREVRITTNIAHLSAKRLKAVEFPVPPLAVQENLVQRCDELLSGVAAMDREVSNGLRRATGLRTALLERAFTGRLVSQQPDEEPASLLLDRITAERAAQPRTQRTRKTTAKRAAKTVVPRASAPAHSAPEPTPAPALAVQQEFDL
ncbi:restriction endonuclease subunit S [Streptomyces pseudovenezuelae]|uniref:Restriction endonuclease subunit S n=1 Tax=Streptomyces pseudovenezuelae TaxID=67350 RepID=A0ABZ1X297_9ACTN|nr:restriction endonuclease subunit S [Streptomyces pseudovenezuelae]